MFDELLDGYVGDARALREDIRELRERAADLFLRGLDLQMEATGAGDVDRAYRATEGVRRAHGALSLARDVIGDV